MSVENTQVLENVWHFDKKKKNTWKEKIEKNINPPKFIELTFDYLKEVQS